MGNRNLLLISDDESLIEIFRQLEGFELTISPHSWYAEASDKHFDVVVVDADFARMTVNITDTINAANVAFSVISPEGLKDFLGNYRETFFDIWVRPIYAELLYSRILKSLEYLQLYGPFSEVLEFYNREIQSPLSLIDGYSDLLLMGLAGKLTQEQTKYLEQIKSNTENLRSILPKDARPIVGGRLIINPRPINFQNILRQEAEFRAKEGTNIELDIAEHLPLILSDNQISSRIFLGLNYLTELCPTDNRKISISAFVINQNEISVTIVVFGCESLAPMSRQKISDFLPKLRAGSSSNSEIRALCVSLSIINSFLYQIGSDVFFESELGKGSTFYFTLPIAKDESSNPS